MFGVLLKDQNHSEQSCSSDEMSETTVDIKKFIAFLHGQQVSPTKVICSEYILAYYKVSKTVFMKYIRVR